MPPGIDAYTARQLLEALFARLGVTTLGRQDDSLRWSASDFVNDALPLLSDVTSTETGSFRCHDRGAIRPVEAEVKPDRIVLKVGCLEVEAQGEPGTHTVAFCGETRILLDGKPFPARALRVEGDVDSLWRVVMEFFPHKLQG